MDSVKNLRHKLTTAVWKDGYDANLKFVFYGEEGGR